MPSNVRIIFNQFSVLLGAFDRIHYQGILAVAEAVQATAEDIAPRDTGYMAAHIELEEHPDNHEVDVVVNADYGVYVELGTRKMAAQPFMLPAAEYVESQIPDICGRVFRDGINEAIGRG